ncbi:uncharacterized protein LOC121719580 [Alosa sapidissima]|uniref:uncharacterized protein LOC121719580 n=1 Tax=Alosa sapidissima TaxID=34773 RepID=UPI001C09AA40|nr:uncharacterized protein LOC121719580 [Alosa sapidissima]
MDNVECKLAEQVRLRRHLYDPALKEHRDVQRCQDSWREIAMTLGKDEARCRKVWKNLRDRFGKAKKRSQALASSGGAAGRRPAPILQELGWLNNFVRPRATEANDAQKCTKAAEASQRCGPAPPQQCGPSDTEARDTDAESVRSSSPCRSTSTPLSIPLSPITTVPTSAAFASPISPCSPRRKKRWMARDESVVTPQLLQIARRKLGQFREYQDKSLGPHVSSSSPTGCFLNVLGHMMEQVDPLVLNQLKHTLYQTVFEHTQQHPR